MDTKPVEEKSEHSPMGGSKAACFIECPGSVSLGRGLPNPESEYAAEGTMAHELAAHCLRKDNDAWVYVDDIDWPDVTKDMADAVQVYLDDVRKWSGQEGPEWVEEGFNIPEVHEHFRGTVDYAKVTREEPLTALRLWDYKHGVGIVVEAEDNAQLKYYAIGLMLKIKEEFDIKTDEVVFTIAQPRAFHLDGPIRRVTYTADELFTWAEEILVPAMVRAETSTDTVAGEWCRFCPVKFRNCPALEEVQEEMGALTHFGDEGDIAKVESLSNERIGYYLDLADKVKIVTKAMQTLGYQRLQAGQHIPGRKLVNGKSNRIWKDTAEEALEEKFKEQAFEERKLLSPAQVEKLPGGKEFAAEYAFKPPANLTMVPATDKRAAVNTDTKSLFTPVKEKV